MKALDGQSHHQDPNHHSDKAALGGPREEVGRERGDERACRSILRSPRKVPLGLGSRQRALTGDVTHPLGSHSQPDRRLLTPRILSGLFHLSNSTFFPPLLSEAALRWGTINGKVPSFSGTSWTLRIKVASPEGRQRCTRSGIQGRRAD